ncbi:TIGR00730 family Rossman fold protein [Marinicrinis lubricantis]|uniref:Cytokinin riboside 5'-monophosphate phosphoribohydrolase n=1 Tax=Marinicrinis lubricantis TaxID=2086470 RepID=A0ABW1IJT5_9BACL
MKRICVFAGSNSGVSPAYVQAAENLGKVMAKSGIELIYGGSKIGLMGKIADTLLRHGGNVIGVMPKGLFRGEMVHAELTILIEVDDMHQRKAKMMELADAFIALPGGLGTFEEIFEVLSWSQLGIHTKPVGLYNIEGFYTPLSNLIQHAIDSGFARPSNQSLYVMSDDADELVKKLQHFERPPAENKWSDLKD